MKRFFALALALLLLPGCGKAADSGPETTAPKESSP